MPSDRTRAATVLNVDDDEPTRYAYSRLLRRAGFNVVEAATGADALHRLKDLPDVVLLDVNLPDMSGTEIARAIKGNLATAHIPVIHLSATAITTDDQVAGLRMAEAYLIQPVAPEHLVALIDALLNYRNSVAQSEALYRKAIQGSTITVFKQDLDLRYTWIFNPTPEFSTLEVVGKTDADLTSAADAAALDAVKRGVIATGQGAQAEVVLNLRGSRRTFDLRIEPSYGPDGRVDGITCVSVDITDRKRTEEVLQAALREAEQSAARVARLQAVSAALGQALTPTEVARVTLDQGVSGLGAAAAVVAMLAPDGTEFHTLAYSGYQPDQMTNWRRFGADEPLPIPDAVRLGEPVLIPSLEAFRSRYPQHAVLNPGLKAWAAVPLIADGGPIGALGLSFDAPQAFARDEVAYLITLAGQCAQALARARLYEAAQQARDQLEVTVGQRTAELRQEVRRRLQAQQQLEQIRESERTRIARELHDELGGALTALKLSLSRLRRQADLPPAAGEALSGVASEVDEIMGGVRRIATELRPAVLDDFGLVAAMQQHFEDRMQRAGLAGTFASDVEDLPLPPDRAVACFRIFQEALTNVLRHAEASEVSVQVTAEDAYATVSVVDNGRGFDAQATRKAGGLGVVGMRERASLISGALQIKSAPGQGTTVLIKVPLDRPAA